MRKSIFVFAITALTLAAHGATASESCGLHSVKGAFGFRCSGHITAGPFAGAYGGVGRVVCDGNGTCTVTGGYQSLNGLIVPFSGAGPYTVEPDCTGVVNYTTPSGPVQFWFVVINHGKELRGFQTDPGTAITCELIEQ